MNLEHSTRRGPVTIREIRRRFAATALAAAGCLLLGACTSNSTISAATATQRVSSPSVIDSGSTTSAVTVAGGAGATTGVSDPCSVLTQAEVDTAVGQPLGPGKPTAPLGNCVWSNSDFSAGVDVTVSDWSSINNAATGGGTKPPPPAVAGVGDEAFWYQGFLYVRKGDAGFLLSIDFPKVSSTADYGLTQAKVLAAAVLGRL